MVDSRTVCKCEWLRHDQTAVPAEHSKTEASPGRFCGVSNLDLWSVKYKCR